MKKFKIEAQLTIVGPTELEGVSFSLNEAIDSVLEMIGDPFQDENTKAQLRDDGTYSIYAGDGSYATWKVSGSEIEEE